ncbi:MAG: SRPBCC domain-containing protein [Nocardioidaceae bacterium]
MKVSGEAVLHAPVEAVWEALLDPRVLVRTIPGCERLETTGDHAYAMTVTAGVASIKGTYAGTVELADLVPGRSLIMKAAGAGAPGTVGADVGVRFADNGDGTTRLSYDADAVVGGMIGGVGQRMLTSVSKRMAGEFFSAVDRVLTEPPTSPAATPLTGATHTGKGVPHDRPSVVGDPSDTGRMVYASPVATDGGGGDFVKGALLGAALVAGGVLIGALTARRREE